MTADSNAARPAASDDDNKNGTSKSKTSTSTTHTEGDETITTTKTSETTPGIIGRTLGWIKNNPITFGVGLAVTGTVGYFAYRRFAGAETADAALVVATDNIIEAAARFGN